MANQSDDYLLAWGDAEYWRLCALARTLEEGTRRVLAKAGLAEGGRCLDAGCGPCELMRLLRAVAWFYLLFLTAAWKRKGLD